MNSEQVEIAKAIVSKNANHGPPDLDAILQNDFGIKSNHGKYDELRNMLDKMINHKDFDDYNEWIQKGAQRTSMGKSNTYVAKFYSGIVNYFINDKHIKFNDFNYTVTVIQKSKSNSDSAQNASADSASLDAVPKAKLERREAPKLKEADEGEQQKEIERLNSEKRELEKKLIVKEASDASNQMEAEMSEAIEKDAEKQREELEAKLKAKSDSKPKASIPPSAVSKASTAASTPKADSVEALMLRVSERLRISKGETANDRRRYISRMITAFVRKSPENEAAFAEYYRKAKAKPTYHRSTPLRIGDYKIYYYPYGKEIIKVTNSPSETTNEDKSESKPQFSPYNSSELIENIERYMNEHLPFELKGKFRFSDIDRSKIVAIIDMNLKKLHLMQKEKEDVPHDYKRIGDASHGVESENGKRSKSTYNSNELISNIERYMNEHLPFELKGKFRFSDIDRSKIAAIVESNLQSLDVKHDAKHGFESKSLAPKRKLMDRIASLIH